MDQATRARVYTGQLDYGLTNRLALQATLPLLSVDFINLGSVQDSDTKFGDLTLVAQYFWSFGYFAAPTMLSAGAGTNIPVGEGIENPISSDKNFISGTVDPVFLASMVFSLQGPWSANANLYARPILSESDDGTKSGTFFLYGIGTAYSLIFSNQSGLDFSFRMNALHRAKDKRDGQVFASSGGDWIYVSPGITYSILGRGIHGLQLWSNLEIPIYQNVNGSQLTEDWTARFGLSYGMHL